PASTTDIVDLAATRVFEEGMNESSYVQGVDVVADLLAFVAVDFVGASLHVAFDEIAQEPVQFDATMVGAGETSPAQATRLHAKITPILLDHHVGRNLGGAEQAVFTVIDRQFFGDPVGKGRIVVIPTGRKFLEADIIRAIAKDFVGAHVHK